MGKLTEQQEMELAWEKWNALAHTRTKVVVIALYYWGEGATLDEAMKNMRSAGFKGKPSKAKPVRVLTFPDTIRFEGVDDMGGICWRVRPDLDCTEQQPEPVRTSLP